MPDQDGYGRTDSESGIPRLLEEMRTLSAAGIGRIAAGWDAHESAGLDQFHAAQKVAVKALEQSDQAEKWEELRRQVLDLTEGRGAMVSWRAEHGDVGHKAERSALGAALAVVSAEHLTSDQYARLVAPMAEALPWLKRS